MFIRSLSLASLIFVALMVSQTPVSAERNSFRIAQTTQLELNNLLLRGRQYVQAKDYDKALETYEQAAILDRVNPKIFSGIGYVYILKEEYDAATEAYEQAIALTPNNPKLYYALGYSLGKKGKHLEAAEAYEKEID